MKSHIPDIQDYKDEPRPIKRSKPNNNDKGTMAVDRQNHDTSMRDGSLKASKSTTRCHRGVWIIILLIAIPLVLCIIVSLVSLAFTVVLYIKTKRAIDGNLLHGVNNTVFVILGNDQNLSNNSLQLELPVDKILSAQEDLQRQLRDLEAMHLKHTHGGISHNLEHTRRGISHNLKAIQKEVSPNLRHTQGGISQNLKRIHWGISHNLKHTHGGISQNLKRIHWGISHKLEEDTRRNISQMSCVDSDSTLQDEEATKLQENLSNNWKMILIIMLFIEFPCIDICYNYSF